MSRTMAWRTEGLLHACVHSREVPSGEEWDSYIASFANMSTAEFGSLRTLVFADGPGPTAGQRAKLRERLVGLRPPTAIMTSQPTMRLVGGLLGMFNPGLRVFAAGDLLPACEHLGLSRIEFVAIREMLRNAYRELHGRDMP